MVSIVYTKGFEQVLPFVTAACIVIPGLVRLHVPLFELTTQRLILVVLVILYLAAGKKNPQMKRIPLGWLIALQIAWALLSTAHSVDPVASFKKLLSVVAEYYLLYFVFVTSITSVRTIYKILGAMVTALTICSILGVLSVYAQFDVMSLFPTVESKIGIALGIQGGGGGRLASTFPHPILYGAALALGLTIAMHLAKLSCPGRRRIILWISILLMFLNIYKSVSRGPWLALILAFVLYMLFEEAKIRKYQLKIAILCILVMIVRPGVFNTISDLYKETVAPPDWNNPKGLSYQYRYELRRVAQSALAKSADRALLGYGMETFSDLGLRGNLGGHDFPFMSCDSAWIEIMIETGYVGLLLIVIILMKPLLLAWKDYRRLDHPAKYLSLTFFILFVIYYFMMLSVAMYSWGQEGYMLWILVAACYAYHNLVRSESRAKDIEESSAQFGSVNAESEPALITGRGPALSWELPAGC
jgi:hypothetical protein